MQLYILHDLMGDELSLDVSESHHAVNVMRMKKGDTIYITDGAGVLITGELLIADAKKCIIKVLERKEEEGKRNYKLYMAVAPTKNSERFEWFLEKATEIGIDTITPLIASRSERRSVNDERLKKIVTAAAKQSLKTYFPVVTPAIAFNDFIFQSAPAFTKLIAHCINDNLPLLKNEYIAGRDAMVLIGPEGDFTMEEVAAAEKKGFKAISLGPSRLRTETAALAACHSIAFMNQ